MEKNLRAGFTNVLLGGEHLLGKPKEDQSSIKNISKLFGKSSNAGGSGE